jgi:hypothetical protein
MKRSYSEQAKATQIHIERIRAMLLAEVTQNPKTRQAES